MFTREFLISVKRKALRKGVWYRSLDGIERGILSLAARVVDRVESVVLGVELVKILGKLRDALKSGFVRRMEEYGMGKARELVHFAEVWGNGVAGKWAFDWGFAMYLTVLDFNQPPGFGVLN